MKLKEKNLTVKYRIRATFRRITGVFPAPSMGLIEKYLITREKRYQRDWEGEFCTWEALDSLGMFTDSEYKSRQLNMFLRTHTKCYYFIQEPFIIIQSSSAFGGGFMFHSGILRDLNPILTLEYRQHMPNHDTYDFLMQVYRRDFCQGMKPVTIGSKGRAKCFRHQFNEDCFPDLKAIGEVLHKDIDPEEFRRIWNLSSAKLFTKQMQDLLGVPFCFTEETLVLFVFLYWLLAL